MNSPSLHTLGVAMHGVRLNLHCQYDELMNHVRGLLDGFVVAPFDAPDIDVTGHWLDRPGDKTSNLFSDAAVLDALGKRMHVGDDELVWIDTYRDPNLQLRFRCRDSSLAFDVLYCFDPSPKKLAKYPDFKRKKFFDLLRYLVMFPIAWRLERQRGWTMIHASAVADRRGAVLVAGPGGAGKTTTCIALASRSGMRFVSENLLFCDGSRVYPVPEPVRLTDQSLDVLGGERHGLRPLKVPGGFKHKTMFQFDGQQSGGVPPQAIFLPRFSHRAFIEPIAPDEASELLLANNRLTLELNDYVWYSAALDLLWPSPNNAARQLEALQQLARSVPCFRLGVDRAAGADGVVDSIVKCLSHCGEMVESMAP